jgi:hypothetical protein
VRRRCVAWLAQDLERELRRAAATQHVASLPEIGVGGGEPCRFGLVEAQVAKLLSAPPEDLVFSIEKRESRLWRSYRGACHSFATTRDRSARARFTQTPYRSFTRRSRRERRRLRSPASTRPRKDTRVPLDPGATISARRDALRPSAKQCSVAPRPPTPQRRDSTPRRRTREAPRSPATRPGDEAR